MMSNGIRACTQKWRRTGAHITCVVRDEYKLLHVNTQVTRNKAFVVSANGNMIGSDHRWPRRRMWRHSGYWWFYLELFPRKCFADRRELMKPINGLVVNPGRYDSFSPSDRRQRSSWRRDTQREATAKLGQATLTVIHLTAVRKQEKMCSDWDQGTAKHYQSYWHSSCYSTCCEALVGHLV